MILVTTAAIVQRHSKAELSIRKSLLSGFAEPVHRFLFILTNTTTGSVHLSEVELSVG